MAGQYGTVELRDFILLFKTLFLAMIKECKKDGFQPDDIRVILTDPQVVSDLLKALQGSEKIGSELKELDFLDGVELTKFIYAAVVEIVSELRA